MVAILFWISLVLLFYCYIGYGLLVGLVISLKKYLAPGKEKIHLEEKVAATLIVTAYNEEAILRERIKNENTLRSKGRCNRCRRRLSYSVMPTPC